MIIIEENDTTGMSKEAERKLVRACAHSSKRRILKHFCRIDYVQNAASVLTLKSSTIKFHLKELMHAGAVEIYDQKKKNVKMPRTARIGGAMGVHYTFYQTTETGKKLLEMMAEPAVPFKPVRVERQPFAPL